MQEPRARGEGGEQAHPSLTLRRLAVALESVEITTVTKPDWDTPAGEQFIREVIAARDAGADVDAIGNALEVPNLRYVVMARERYL